MKISIPKPYKKKALTGHSLLMKNQLSEYLKKGMLTVGTNGKLKKG